MVKCLDCSLRCKKWVLLHICSRFVTHFVQVKTLYLCGCARCYGCEGIFFINFNKKYFYNYKNIKNIEIYRKKCNNRNKLNKTQYLWEFESVTDKILS